MVEPILKKNASYIPKKGMGSQLIYFGKIKGIGKKQFRISVSWNCQVASFSDPSDENRSGL